MSSFSNLHVSLWTLEDLAERHTRRYVWPSLWITAPLLNDSECIVVCCRPIGTTYLCLEETNCSLFVACCSLLVPRILETNYSKGPDCWHTFPMLMILRSQRETRQYMSIKFGRWTCLTKGCAKLVDESMNRWTRTHELQQVLLLWEKQGAARTSGHRSESNWTLATLHWRGKLSQAMSSKASECGSWYACLLWPLDVPCTSTEELECLPWKEITPP